MTDPDILNMLDQYIQIAPTESPGEDVPLVEKPEEEAEGPADPPAEGEAAEEPAAESPPEVDATPTQAIITIGEAEYRIQPAILQEL